MPSSSVSTRRPVSVSVKVSWVMRQSHTFGSVLSVSIATPGRE